MQTFGRMRLDVENCMRELVTFGVAGKIAGDRHAALRLPAARGRHRPRPARRVPRAPRHRQPRRSLAGGPALPRNDRPRREDARRVRVDPHRREVRHLRADPRADRIGQGSRGADDPRAEPPRHEQVPGRQLRGAARHAVRVGALRLRERARSPARTIASRAGSRWPTTARCSSTRSATSRSIGQAKLLRALEERRFERLGGNEPIEVNFRLISATNRPLDQFVRDSRFREDLYYRVNAFSIRLPSLRERASDIPVLAQRFLARYCAANGLPLDGKTFAKEAMDLLLQYHWPGNIRELESTVARAALSSPGRSIRGTDVEFLHAVEAPPDAARQRLPSLADAERAHIVRVLESGELEQETGGQRAGNQPRHALSQDRGIRAGERSAAKSERRRWHKLTRGRTGEF